MENFFIYLAKASGLIALFFIAYYILIKKETFFSTNRWFLLAGLFTSAFLPLLVYTKIVWIDPSPPIKMLSFSPSMQLAESIQEEPVFEINWMYVAVGLYLLGVLFFMIRFLIDLFKVVQLLKGKEIKQEQGFQLIDSATIQSPFSFFRYIVYNSTLLQPNELENIITHEKVHSKQLHSLDMLVSQLFCIVFWFNPFIWLYKKAISQNLEFIADAEAAKSISDIQAYQKTLLKITLQPECTALTNHFYQSLIKKRIIMLNKQQSKKWNFWKYAIVLPLLVAFVFLFQIEVIAQEKTVPLFIDTNAKDYIIVMEINKDSNEKELNQEKMLFKQEFDADISFSDITRNVKGEIVTIKVTVKDKDNQKTYPVYEITKNKGDNRPINPFTVAIEKEEGSDKNLITFNDPVISVLNGSAPEIKVDSIYINKKDISAKQNNKSFSKPHANVPTKASITERVNQVNNSPLRIVEVKSEKKLEKDDLVKVLSDQGFDFNKAYLSVDGKEVTLEDLKTAVADVMALKSFSIGTAPNEKGAEKYGSKAYNGFIVITTQTKP
ncbi:Regulatory protein BlaR1 [compost metagenome]